MKTIVYYYSRTGSNNYLAERISGRLKCEKEEIRPRINNFFLFLLNISAGVKAVKNKPSAYDRVFVVGPVWVGRFIPPLKGFLKKYREEIKNLYFVSCCGSGDDQKDEKFGHGPVFKQVKELIGDKCRECVAFPIGLVVGEDKKKDADTIMKTRLTDENFKGEIEERFDRFIEAVKE